MAWELAGQLGLPRKRCWLDKRTHTSLRDMAATALLSAWACPSAIAPHRLTERSIECRFGRLRSMFPNSKMAVPDFWRASAKDMRRQLSQWNPEESPPLQAESMLSEEVFVATATRAFTASLKLASLCSPFSTEQLKSMLNMAQSCPNWLETDDDSDNEECEDNDTEDVKHQDPSEIYKVIRDGQAFSEKLADEDADEAVNVKEPAVSDADASALEQSSKSGSFDPKIAAATLEVCEGPQEQDCKNDHERLLRKVAKSGKFTLSLALRNHDTLESAMHDLYLLCCHLRMHPLGCDSQIVKNAMHSRSCFSHSNMKWHNAVRHQIAVQQASEQIPAARTSRRAAWIESCESLRKERCSALPSTLSVQSGHVCACLVHNQWEVCLVMAVWRVLRKGSGAQLTFA